MVKYYLNTLVFTWLSLIGLSAQSASKLITGQVIEKSSKLALEYATVSIFNTAQELEEGTITDEEGQFKITTDLKAFQIVISFIGYEDLSLDYPNLKSDTLSLGQLALVPQNNKLETVVVRAEKSEMVFKLDKRVFNVGKDLSSAGGSVLDVLSNVPSVDVTLEGAISLRGNTNIQILINGKPSALTAGNSNTLGTLTANMIDRIEVVTNPSAKYDAEGTSGIINIILKKEERRGFNGSVTFNTGVPNNHSIGLSLNQRTERFNIFGQLGAGKRTFLSSYSGITIDRLSSDNSTLNNEGDAEKNEQFYNLLLGADYLIDAHNVITLSGHLGYEIEDEFSDTYYDLSSNNSPLEEVFSRAETTEATNPKWHYELQYQKTFEDKEKQSLTLSAIGSFFGKEQSSNFDNTTQFGNRPESLQESFSDFKNISYIFQGDYIHPISEKMTWETGVKYQRNENSNDYEVANQINGERIIDPAFTNQFDFDQNVLGIYTTYAIEWEHFGIQAGLRYENTALKILLANSNENTAQQYGNLFPSAHASWQFSDALSFQVGYSRRIQRPSGWDLNPFFDIRDNLNLYIGNPNLQPEFTDAFEFTFIRKWDKIDLNGTIFHRRTNNVFNDILMVVDSLTITRPENVGRNNYTGIEWNSKYTPSEWLDLSGEFNWGYFSREGLLENESFDFSNTRWAARLTAKIEAWKKLDIEVRARYSSAVEGIISNERPVFFTDFGLRTKLFNGKGSLNFSIRDVFNSRRFRREADLTTFYRYETNRWSVRSVVLGLSYSFGKGEAMEYSGRKLF